MEGATTTKNDMGSSGSQYLVITVKGFAFAEKWYQAEHIPPRITRLYQLLLWLIWMKGIMPVGLAKRMGYSESLIAEALSSAYVEVVAMPSRLPDEIRKKITAMIGKAPKKFYV